VRFSDKIDGCGLGLLGLKQDLRQPHGGGLRLVRSEISDHVQGTSE
jgi:hypothetical protein